MWGHVRPSPCRSTPKHGYRYCENYDPYHRYSFKKDTLFTDLPQINSFHRRWLKRDPKHWSVLRDQSFTMNCHQARAGPHKRTVLLLHGIKWSSIIIHNYVQQNITCLIKQSLFGNFSGEFSFTAGVITPGASSDRNTHTHTKHRLKKDALHTILILIVKIHIEI